MNDKRYTIAWMLFLMVLVNYLDRVNISTVAPVMMKELSIQPRAFGVVLSAFAVGYGVMQIPGGYLADRYGAKLLVVLTPLVWSIFTFATGLASTLTTLIVVRFCFGLCEGAGNSALFRLMGDSFEAKDRSRIGSRVILGFALGPALAGPLVLWILSKSTWHYVFFWSALPGVLLAIAMIVVVPSSSGTGASVPRATTDHSALLSHWRGFLTQRTTWLLLVAYALFFVGYWGYLGWMPSYLVMDRHVNLKTLGIGASIPYVGGALGLWIIGNLGSGLFLHRRGMLAALCMLGAALSLFVTFNVASIEATIAGLTAAAFFLYGALGPYGAIVNDLAPESVRGSFAGLINTGGQIGGALAPIVVGLLVEASGNFLYGFVFLIAALLGSAMFFGLIAPASKVSERSTGAVKVA